MGETQYKIFKIQREEHAGGIRYILPVYSGDKSLRMLLDSGADASLIQESSIEGCTFKKYRAKLPLVGLYGELIKVRCGALSFRLIKDCSTDYSYQAAFKVLPLEESSTLQTCDVDGLLGSDFLDNCIIDFKDSFIIVFADKHPNINFIKDILMTILPVKL